MIDWRFWLGLAALLPQALYVRSTALRLGPAAGPRGGTVAGEGEVLRLLLIGDSIIAGVGVDQLENALPGQLARALASQSGRPVHWQAVGQGGMDAAEIHQRLLPGLASAQADLIVLSVGVNDVTGLHTGRRWRQGLARLLDRLANDHLRKVESVPQVVHLGIPPLGHFPGLPQPLRALLGHRAGRLDEIARIVIAQRPWATHIVSDFVPEPDQFAADGYHPSAAGCHLWAEGVAAEILGPESP